VFLDALRVVSAKPVTNVSLACARSSADETPNAC